jgi:cardiolipin synthase
LSYLRYIPNFITALRILLVAPIAVELFHHQLITTLWLFAIAAASDMLDGFLAKHFGWQTELGAILDPIADKLLMVSVFITLAVLKLMPLWLMGAAVVRDAVIVGGAAAYRLFVGPLNMRPSIVSKFNTACQALFVLSVVCRIAFDLPPQWVLIGLGALVFLTIVISGIDYVLIFGRRAARELKSRPRPAAA